ncbi:hypothetical protein EON77_18300 [bacterium]|nr:MAG: hypothetical protein EON77_18300 [bacterium]
MGDAVSIEQAITQHRPTFVLTTTGSCTNVDTATGTWVAETGSFEVCQGVSRKMLSGCGYAWTSETGAPTDILELAKAHAASIDRLVPRIETPSCAPATPGVEVPGKFEAPVERVEGSNPGSGSTPCGACQIGIATDDSVFLVLPETSSSPRNLHLVPVDSLSTPPVIVTVPPGVRVFTAPTPQPGAFVKGAAVGVIHED